MKIGFSTKDITPASLVVLGGSSVERLVDRVRDPLTVTAMALESADGEEQAVFVSCDILHINQTLQDGVCDKVRQTIPGLNPDTVVLNATHTHNGPLISEPYWSWIGFDRSSAATISLEDFLAMVIERIAEAVNEAWQGRTEGGLSWGQGFAVLGHSRRVLYDDGMAKMFGKVDTPHFSRFEGFEDYRVELMFAWDERQRLTGMIVNVACTSQFLTANVISADLFGEVRKQVWEKWGQSVFILGMIGAAGDVHPRDMLTAHHNKHVPDVRLSRRVKGLVRTIEDVLEPSREHIQSDPVFKHRVKSLDLPLQKVSKTEVETAEKEWKAFQEWLSKQQDRATAFQLFVKWPFDDKFSVWNHLSILLREEKTKTDPFYHMKLHAVRIGETAFITNPFELFTEYGLQIKARSRTKQTFIVELSTGTGGYLPTAEAIAGGGYSARIHSVQVGDEGGRILVESSLEAIGSLW
jgi:hypothetical protein